ncbi:hypothetical protein GQ600_21915 [Phytophthora cactorum]|nr:hypothetical protein GQ600_21915 [Phytophthora cactorum]
MGRSPEELCTISEALPTKATPRYNAQQRRSVLPGSTDLSSLSEICGGILVGKTSNTDRYASKGIDRNFVVDDASMNNPEERGGWAGALEKLKSLKISSQSRGVCQKPPTYLVTRSPSIITKVEAASVVQNKKWSLSSGKSWEWRDWMMLSHTGEEFQILRRLRDVSAACLV